MDFNVFRRFLLIAVFFFCAAFSLEAQEIKLARVKYRGGGDWYNDPSALTNLIRFAKQHANLPISDKYDDVEIGSSRLMNYPFVFMTGHGGLQFNELEIKNVRNYLDNGGFIFIDDDYGFNSEIRNMINSLYPTEELVEIPFEHKIYSYLFDYSKGIPKVHEHDNKAPQAFGLFLKGQLVLFYCYESNLADGWTNADVHNNPESVRTAALEMGTNVLFYAFTLP